jgi:NAD(P)-dependent dehydrogenase (short-subunit alcohol dehydrogenase family)
MSRDAVLVTGGSMGLGLATALYLGEHGFPVYASYLGEDELPGLHTAIAQRGLERMVRPVALDVTRRGQAAQVSEHIASEQGGIFGLVNNAGLSQHGCFEDTSDADLRRLYEVNVFGAMWTTQAVLPYLRQARRGRVVTMSSVGGRIASFSRSGYCSTKFALEGFSEALALELAPFGVQVSLIEPGIVNTPHWTINRGVVEGAKDPHGVYWGMFQRHQALAEGRLTASRIRPEHVAAAVYRALTDPRPRLRYVVGRPAGLALTLRRYVPDGVFERVYFGFLLRQLRAGGV